MGVGFKSVEYRTPGGFGRLFSKKFLFFFFLGDGYLRGKESFGDC